MSLYGLTCRTDRLSPNNPTRLGNPQPFTSYTSDLAAAQLLYGNISLNLNAADGNVAMFHGTVQINMEGLVEIGVDAGDSNIWAYMHEDTILLYATRLKTSSRAPIMYLALQQIIEIFLSHGPVTVNCIGAELTGLLQRRQNQEIE
jgi:hypothetical protein